MEIGVAFDVENILEVSVHSEVAKAHPKPSENENGGWRCYDP